MKSSDTNQETTWSDRLCTRTGNELLLKQILDVVRRFSQVASCGIQNCAVENALYDLAGKTKGTPVSELPGGRRQAIRSTNPSPAAEERNSVVLRWRLCYFMSASANLKIPLS